MVQQLSFQDIQGQELALIRQKLLAWGPTYEIYRDNGLFAVVKQELFTFFNCWFTVDVPGPDDLEAKGDFTDHEYEFWRQFGLRATVSKQWFAWSDTCAVEIVGGEDDLLILASTVVIDLACQADQQRR